MFLAAFHAVKLWFAAFLQDSVALRYDEVSQGTVKLQSSVCVKGKHWGIRNCAN